MRRALPIVGGKPAPRRRLPGLAAASLCAALLSAPCLAQQAPEDAQIPSFSEVRVSEYMTVDLVVQNDDIRNVLQKLAVQSRRNIVPSQKVRGRVSCVVYGVPFYDGLDALLNANGMGYIERADFIFVVAADELAQLQASARRKIVKMIPLDYLRPDDAKRFAQGLLSRDGKMEVTKDEGGAGAGGSDATPRASGAGGGSIYTPNRDEYSLLNGVVVHDFPEHIEEIEELIRTLDTKPAQVLIESTILQTTLTDQTAFGIDFALLKDVQFTDFFGFPSRFNPLDFVSPARTPSESSASTAPDQRSFVSSTPGNTGLGPATVRAGIIQDDIGVFIRALDEVTDVTLLSNPKVLALNRQRARVLIGTRVGYLETTLNDNQTVQSVKFLDTGVELDMRPFVLNNGMVRIELAPKVSQVVFRTVSGTAAGVSQQIPDEQLQTVNTDIHVPQGYTAVLGGLFREDTSRSRSQVPILGDIPLLGAAFRGHDDRTDRVEIIFLIKPTVMQDRIMITQGRDAEAWGDAIRSGAREGMLPWSRERQSARLNVEAERRAASGDVDGALWAIRRSLELHPIQPDAVRMRERLVSKPTVWPNRSILERMIQQEAMTDEPPLFRSSPALAPPEDFLRDLTEDRMPDGDGGAEPHGEPEPE